MQTTKGRRTASRGDTTVRIDKQTDSTLSILARERQEDKKSVLAYSVEKLRRDMILEKFAAGFTEIKSDHKEWAKEMADREPWQQASLEVISNESE